MPLETLAFNDVLNDKTAHFFKSGNTRRSSKNQRLNKLHQLLPEKGNYETNLEYDIWYDFKNEPKIRGYVYTDVMTKFLYLKPASSMYSESIIKEAIKHEITEEGEAIFQDMLDTPNDKYKLSKSDVEYPYVIFLPGTNILFDVVDQKRIKNAVEKDGAKLKLHPLTSPFAVSYLKTTYGKENIIDRKLSGHDILKKSKIVGTFSNSEMGLVALAQGSKVNIFDKKNISKKTYTAIYKALWREGEANIEELKRLLSCDFCGLVSYLSKNPEQKIKNFWDFFKDVIHVKPKKSKSLNTGKK